MLLAFVDLETTGATATKDSITEIGIVTVNDDGTVQEWSTLVKPESSIPPFIENLTGISNAMVADAPCFADVAEHVFRTLKGRLFVAHNARFDYGFLKQAFKREEIDFRATTLCTVKLSKTLFPAFAKHNLDSLIERHGLQAMGRHRALADAQLIYQFWVKLQTTIEPEALANAVKTLTARPAFPTNLDPALLDDLPELPGVYLFYGENALPLYVGKAKNLRQRVLSHFAGDVRSAKEMNLSQQVRRVEWIETGGEIGALLKESELVKTLQPVFNRQLRRNQELCTVELGERENAPYDVRVAFARDVDWRKPASRYGLFNTAREANKHLADLAQTNGLCKVVMGLEAARAGAPCFARQLRKCKGACVGDESVLSHNVRLLSLLSEWQVRDWPFSGPAYLKEGRELLLIDRWAFLGTAKTEHELWDLLDIGRAQFDKDAYRILMTVAHRLIPLPLLPPLGRD